MMRTKFLRDVWIQPQSVTARGAYPNPDSYLFIYPSTPIYLYIYLEWAVANGKTDIHHAWELNSSCMRRMESPWHPGKETPGSHVLK